MLLIDARLRLIGPTSGFRCDAQGRLWAHHRSPGYETCAGLGWHAMIVQEAVDAWAPTSTPRSARGLLVQSRALVESRRLELSERVWDHLEATDSSSCRNCRSRQAMSFEVQEERARGAHQRGIDQGPTCITCHKGVGQGIEPPNWLRDAVDAR